MSEGPWSDDENDLIVADYFAMLADDLAGRSYSKTDHNRRLRERVFRPRTSIEYKHQNISAVLKGMGEDWIRGYKPAVNYQAALEDAVQRWLDCNADWLQRVSVAAPGNQDDARPIWIGPAPTLSNQPPPAELDKMLAIARRFNAAERDERNRALGRAGEMRALEHEQSTLRDAGRHDLARRVRWVSEQDGDGAGFDIASFDADGRRRLVEVKTTNGWERSPFHISRNELDVANANRSEWVLFRLWNFSRSPCAFELRPPLDAHVSLTPTTFQASFQ